MGMRALRNTSGLSQSELAAILGAKQNTVSMWETGKSLPRADKLPQLAKALGCTVDELLESLQEDAG